MILRRLARARPSGCAPSRRPPPHTHTHTHTHTKKRSLRRLTSEVERDPVPLRRYGRQRQLRSSWPGSRSCSLSPLAHFRCGDLSCRFGQGGEGRGRIFSTGAHLRLQRGRKRAKEAPQKLTTPRGLPGRSPTPVLTGPCAAELRRSKEIRCIRRGMAVSDSSRLPGQDLALAR